MPVSLPIEIENLSFNFLVHDNETLSNLLRQRGYHNRNDINLFRDFLTPDSTFIDIGANIGWYTVIASLLLGENGKVISIEPEKSNLDLLQQNCKINNCDNVSIVTAAALDKNGTTNFYLNSENFGDHSIAKNTHLRTFSKIESEQKIITTIAVDSLFTLDEWRKVSLIKIDTQGCESAVLAGMKNNLIHHRPKLIIEFAPAHIYQAGYSAFELFAFIENYGYTPYKICDRDRTPCELELYTIDTMFMDTHKFKHTYESIDLLLTPIS